MNKPSHGLAGILVGAVALAVLCILPTGPAHCADEPTVIPTVTVSYADLNLSDAAGVRLLYQRIVAAAQRVCGPEVNNTDPNPVTPRERCIAEAVSRAVNNVGSPALTRYAAAKGGAATGMRTRSVT
jgi:UrcA family protein